MANLRSVCAKCSNVHYWATGLSLLSVVPLLRRLHLPLSFQWDVLGAFYLLLTLQAIFLSVILCLIGFDSQTTFGSSLQRFKHEKFRIIAVIAFFLILGTVLSWGMALVLTVDTVALIEFFRRASLKTGRKAAFSVAISAFYLVVSWVLVFAYNDIIVSTRFFAAKDTAFNSIDLWLLRGGSVSQVCHWALHIFPVSVFRSLEIIYLGMFPLLGAGLILISVCDGARQGLKFVGTIIFPSYLALILFYVWTSQGPYYLCPTHFAEFPASLKTYTLQRASIDHAMARWHHIPLARLSTDYFIAFPCLHISAPLIVTWFLRRWKRILALMLVYDTLLVIAIVLLEWHYLVDVFAGIFIASLSIFLINYGDLLQRKQASPEVATLNQNTSAQH